MVTTRTMTYQKWYITGKLPTLFNRKSIPYLSSSYLPIPQQLEDLVDEIHTILDPGLLQCAGKAVFDVMSGIGEASEVGVKKRLVYHLCPGIVEMYVEEPNVDLTDIEEEFEEYVMSSIAITKELSIKELLKTLGEIAEEYNTLD